MSGHEVRARGASFAVQAMRLLVGAIAAAALGIVAAFLFASFVVDGLVRWP